MFSRTALRASERLSKRWEECLGGGLRFVQVVVEHEVDFGRSQSAVLKIATATDAEHPERIPIRL
jgi:hypothetical protein